MPIILIFNSETALWEQTKGQDGATRLFSSAYACSEKIAGRVATIWREEFKDTVTPVVEKLDFSEAGEISRTNPHMQDFTAH